VVNAPPRPLYPWERDPVPIVWETGWAPASVWKGAENLVPTRIRLPDRPALGESLNQLQIFDAVSECKIEDSHNLQSKPSKWFVLVNEITLVVLTLGFMKLEMHHAQKTVTTG